MNSREKKYRPFAGELRNLLCITLFLFLSYQVYPQISYGGKPAWPEIKSTADIPVITMPEFDAGEYERVYLHKPESRLKPMVFAKAFPVNIDPESAGAWEILPDRSRVWRVAMKSAGAYSLNIIFSKFRLEPGVSVFVYNPDRSHILGSYDHRNNQLSNSLAVEPVEGEKLIIEMQVGHGVEYFGELVIGSLNHDFTGILGLKDNRFGLSGRCNIDISCPPGNIWQTEKNAVARILTGGTQLCTGILVNNSANDGKPYFLTANHCIDDSTKAANTVFVFGYESTFCNGTDGLVSNSLSGSDLLVTQANLDFTLVEIREMPPPSYRPWYAGWDRSGNVPERSVSIHHPNGDVKKIAIDSDPPSTATFGSGYTINGHWRIGNWEMGTTEGGSSGSPLFDQDGKLRGVLTGGDAGCGNAQNDFYSKFSLAWDRYEGITQQLKPWLDPTGTAAETLEGINPYAGGELSADFTVSTGEICFGDKVVFTDFSTGGIDSWHWDFGPDANPSAAVTRGPHLVEFQAGGIKTFSLTVAGNNGTDIKDMEFPLVVKTTQIPIADFLYTHDDLTVQFTDSSTDAASYYWEFGDKRVSTLKNPTNTYTAGGEYTVMQMVRNRACSDTSVQTILLSPNFVEMEEPGRLKIYPLPASTFVIVETDQPFNGEVMVELFSITGRSLIRRKSATGGTSIMLELGQIPTGTYILKIIYGNEKITTMLPVLR